MRRWRQPLVRVPAGALRVAALATTVSLLAASPVTAAPGAVPGPVTDPASLAAAVARLERMRTAAASAAIDTAAEAARLDAAQLQAGQKLADALGVLAQRRAASSGQVRELYVSGGDLSMFGELLTGGRPEDLVDRARLLTAVGDRNLLDSRAAAAAAREAADLADTVAAVADAQISLADRAGMRAATLTEQVNEVSTELATAQAAARLAAQRRAARAADAAAVARLQAAQDRQAGDLARQVSVAARAARSVFTAAQLAGAAGSRHLPAGTVPSDYRVAIERAGRSCSTLSPALLAAQLATESGWNPLAISSAGAQGLAQFLPGTWAAHGIDGDGDSRVQVFDPYDAIASAAAYDCAVARTVRDVPGDPVDTMLAAYNAGPGAVLAAGGVPADPGVAGYVAAIRGRATGYIGTNGQLR